MKKIYSAPSSFHSQPISKIDSSSVTEITDLYSDTESTIYEELIVSEFKNQLLELQLLFKKLLNNINNNSFKNNAKASKSLKNKYDNCLNIDNNYNNNKYIQSNSIYCEENETNSSFWLNSDESVINKNTQKKQSLIKWYTPSVSYSTLFSNDIFNNGNNPNFSSIRGKRSKNECGISNNGPQKSIKLN